MTVEIMEYMVWVIEVAAQEFFGGDKNITYNTLKNSGLWDIYVEHYDVQHTLGKEYLVEEMREYFRTKGVGLRC
ncbi:MAG: DUF3791 domain-containing protein [Oscillospiraceae bacterium]|nr:DUF3791 domain-containing protein [Oscillospiraceae bacterium]